MTLIGLYAARFVGERQLTAWHLVESEVEDRVITRCGREMHHRLGKALLLIDTQPPVGLCARCKR